METYKIQKKQNIFDVSIQLFGSIEGVFDLMANNPTLSFDTHLKEGDELLYDKQSVIYQNIVDELQSTNIVPANNERHVYYKETAETLRCCIQVPYDSSFIMLELAGDGNMIVDWGDNTDLETVTLEPTIKNYTHYFDNAVTSRCVKLYGNFNIKTWNLSQTKGEVYLTTPLTVDEVSVNENNIPLHSLFLFKNTYSVVLSKRFIDSLDCIKDMSLSYVELTNNEYANNLCIDDYLIYIAKNHNLRRNCKVVLDIRPTGVYKEPTKDVNGNYVIKTGMEAVYVILHETAWNEAGPWVFVINGVEYSADNINFSYKLPLILD